MGIRGEVVPPRAGGRAWCDVTETSVGGDKSTLLPVSTHKFINLCHQRSTVLDLLGPTLVSVTAHTPAGPSRFQLEVGLEHRGCASTETSVRLASSGEQRAPAGDQGGRAAGDRRRGPRHSRLAGFVRCQVKVQKG